MPLSEHSARTGALFFIRMKKENNQIEFDIDHEIFPRLLGVGDVNLRYLQSRFKSSLTARGSRISIRGSAEECSRVKRVFQDLEALYREKYEVDMADIDTVLRLAGFNGDQGIDGTQDSGAIRLDVPRSTVYSKNAHQERYIRAMESNSIVFSIGPAGTGKTYLAVAAAVDRYHRRSIDKIILVRPVIESGETLGYLPGDILEKVDPYFRPLYDALDEMMSREKVRRSIDRGSIEIAPLAYMRGRTLNNAFVILDEAQNTTSGQMKMFLTRLGASSRAVLTGDLTQVDLPDPSRSGLLEARDLLQGIDGISFITFNDKDVVRHKLVADILRAYERGTE